MKRIVISANDLRKALTVNNGSVQRAASDLGVSRWTVYRLMQNYGIKVRAIVEQEVA